MLGSVVCHTGNGQPIDGVVASRIMTYLVITSVVPIRHVSIHVSLVPQVTLKSY